MNSLNNKKSEAGTLKNPEQNSIEESHAQKQLRPSKKKFLDKQAAIRILTRYGTVDVNTLTEDEKVSLKWARGIDIGSKRPTKDKADEVSTSTYTEDVLAAKRKKLDSNSVLEDNKKMLAILDKSDEDGCIPHEQWPWVEAALAAIFLEILERFPGPPPSCQDAGWHNDEIKLITCEDERSAMLYKAAIDSIGEVYPGAELVAVNKYEIPARPRASVLLPASPSDAASILRMLTICNPSLPTHNWAIEKLEESIGATRQATVVLNAKTLAMLAGTNGVISYGFSKVTFRVCEKSQEILQEMSALPKSNVAIKMELIEDGVEVESGLEGLPAATFENYATAENK